MEYILFQNFDFDFFRNFTGSKRSKKNFPRILIKNIPFDAESDVGKGYMVIFDLFCYYFGPKYDFWKKDEIP